MRDIAAIEQNPLWYKDAIIYEVHVKAFYDGNGDGVGDFQGLREKLSHIEDLGITAVWLLPFYPSPLRDDGYDISNYFGVHPDYGTLRDFREFLKEAHRRGIRVITELVLNHTSDQNKWFKKSRVAEKGSPWRDFYIWSDTPNKYGDARIIFKDFESSNWAWDQVAQSYYFHRFYSHQPDLNFDNPRVRDMIFRVVDFWLGMGVDGLRLDAVPYLFKRDGTNCENLPETFAFLKGLRAHVDSKFKGRVLLAEANQWPEDAASYFGKGDLSHMAFHFPLMPRIFISLQMESRFPIVDILEQTPVIPDVCQWALFLRNHDELTLEMVTDQERDYMYKVYAKDPRARVNLGIRRRMAPLLENNRSKIQLMYVILFSLPGTPFVYYGEEIGMGDNYYLGDRNGVRTPMQWSPDRNAGFSRANPQKVYLPVIIDPEYHYESINVENQQRNTSSLLWWMKRAIAVRKRLKALGRGTMEFLSPENSKILAFIRTYGDECILVVANLSRYFQVAELDLSKYAGIIPRTVYSETKFPVIRESPYILTLGPYNCIWLFLKKGEETLNAAGAERAIPELRSPMGWGSILRGRTRDKLENEILPQYLKVCRWFGSKANILNELRIVESLTVHDEFGLSYLLLLQATYLEGPQEIYLLPISLASTKAKEGPGSEPAGPGARTVPGGKEISVRSKSLLEESPEAIVAYLYGRPEEGIIYDSAYNDLFREALFSLILRKRRIRGEKGSLIGRRGKMFIKTFGGARLNSQRLRAEQSNTSFLYEDKFYFKLFRNLKEGVNPDLEMVRFLTENRSFRSVSPFVGSIEYERPESGTVVLGVLQEFVANQGDGWSYTLDSVGRYYEMVLSGIGDIHETPGAPASLFSVNPSRIPSELQQLIEGHYLEMTALLGKRTGEMHLNLASESEEEDFNPEPFSILYQRAVFQSMRNLLRNVIQAVRNRMERLPEPFGEKAAAFLKSEERIINHLQEFVKHKFPVTRIRIHGDFHLGQVLYTGKDFVVIDFEGEPARELTERRLKQSPFKDVAGMVRSFHYAAFTALHSGASARPEDVPLLQPWAELWYRYVAGIFLVSYLDTVGNASFVPDEKEDLHIMLKAYLLEKAIYELGYELNNRPDWAITPLNAIEDLIGKDDGS